MRNHGGALHYKNRFPPFPLKPLANLLAAHSTKTADRHATHFVEFLQRVLMTAAPLAKAAALAAQSTPIVAKRAKERSTSSNEPARAFSHAAETTGVPGLEKILGDGCASAVDFGPQW
jgi:hypothetical protein